MNNAHPRQHKLAIIAQSLYLANLLILPGLAFLILLNYFFKHRSNFGIARIHLFRALQLCLLNGLLLAVLPLFYIYFSSSQSQAIMIMLFYFVCMHAAFVLIGMLNLSRAMAHKLPLF